MRRLSPALCLGRSMHRSGLKHASIWAEACIDLGRSMHRSGLKHASIRPAYRRVLEGRSSLCFPA
eukprot:4435117-Pleurochrysis_carterae.AAC.1